VKFFEELKRRNVYKVAVLPQSSADSGIMPPMKYWEIIADKLSAAGWSWAIAAPSQMMR